MDPNLSLTLFKVRAMFSIKNTWSTFRRSGQNKQVRRPRVRISDEAQIIYAIGDIHGCLGELLTLEERIYEDARRTPGKPVCMIILGDFIDRGPDSAAIIDHFLELPRDGFTRLVLAGNHEIAMEEFFRAPDHGADWLSIGGIETLRSYGLTSAMDFISRPRKAAQAARLAVPETHLTFLGGLPLLATWGKYVFVHAGIRPTFPLDQQSDKDLITIRGEFLQSQSFGGYVVVHGHTAVALPQQHSHRVAIDTACYATGNLTAARIEGELITFL
jgi:serine/threonine protein phosphatase 1